jgi:hypothetical protein
MAGEPPNDGRVSAELLAGYGINEPFRLGVGARIGYTLPIRVYFGAYSAYHFGSTNSTVNGDFRYHVWLAGGEGGYEIPVGPIVVRPYLGLGLGEHTWTSCLPTIAGVWGCAEHTDPGFALWPGVSGLLPLGVALLGVDAQFDIVTGKKTATPAVFGTAGVRF